MSRNFFFNTALVICQDQPPNYKWLESIVKLTIVFIFWHKLRWTLWNAGQFRSSPGTALCTSASTRKKNKSFRSPQRVSESL